MAKDLLTKHGKYYELNPYKIIQRIEEIREKVFELDKWKYNLPDNPKYIDEIYDEIDDLIDQMYEQGQLPISYIRDLTK